MHNMEAMTTVQQGWSWKVEPVSPPPLPDLDTDSWFTPTGDYLLAGSNSENSIIVPDTIEVDKKPLTRAETATRLINELDEWIKEEPFSDWYEEKIDIPIFEDLETVSPLPAAPPPPPPPPPQQRKDVQAYNKEFIDVCPYDNTIHNVEGKVHIPNIAVLPEQRPPHHQHNIHQPHSIVSSTAMVVPMQLGEQTSTLMQEFEFVLSNHETLTPPESPRDDGMGLTMLQDMRTEELDELVRIRVESLVEGPDNSCSSSLHEDSTADSPASSDSGYDDPDWTPEPLVSENPKQGKRRRLTKPYSRAPPEEKRQRKKEQNKNAATRYRLKKKAEIEEILGEERELQDKNEKLKTDLGELAREIKYLKNLMRDVFKAKGLIK